MFRNPLVALDASPFGDTATETGLMLARQFHGTLYGMHAIDLVLLEGSLVQDLGGSLGLEPFQNISGQLEPLLEEKGKLILDRFRVRCEQASVPCHTELRRGIVANEIVDAAGTASVAIVGRQGEHAKFHDDDLSRVAETVARRSSGPVWVCPGRPPEGLQRLVCGYDASPRASRALELSIELGEAFGAEVTVLTAGDNAEQRQARLDEARERFQRTTTTVHYEGREGVPAEALLAVADETQADLLVIGAYGHNRLVEWVLGSTTNVVLRRASCPVLLAR